MGRRRRLVDKGSNGLVAMANDLTVSKRSRNGWTLAQAAHLLEQGYTLEHVTKTTGWTATVIRNHKEKKP